MLICNRKFQKKRIKKLTRIYYCKDLNELEVNFANRNFALQFSDFLKFKDKARILASIYLKFEKWPRHKMSKNINIHWREYLHT